jgi:quinol-cytochrome oxidoreductase complex cytochrome b subunit
MQNRLPPKTLHPKVKNYGPHARFACWAILIFSIIYALIGDCAGHPAIVIWTVLAGVYICTVGTPWAKMSAEKKERQREFDKVMVGCVMIIYMVLNAWTIIYHSTLPLDSFRNDSGDWIANRFLYLFGLGFFLPAIVEPKLQRSSAFRTGALVLRRSLCSRGSIQPIRSARKNATLRGFGTRKEC